MTLYLDLTQDLAPMPFPTPKADILGGPNADIAGNLQYDKWPKPTWSQFFLSLTGMGPTELGLSSAYNEAT